jgi:hypothetical protein
MADELVKLSKLASQIVLAAGERLAERFGDVVNLT